MLRRVRFRYTAVLVLLALGLSPIWAQQPDEPALPEIVVEPELEEEPQLDPVDALPEDLQPLPVFRAEGLNSTLRRNLAPFDDPVHITIRDRQQIERRAPLSIAQALEHEVGVLIQSTGAGQASPFIRGLTGPQTLILVDGIRMNNSTFRFGPNQYFGTIDPGMIERIEVIRGPQSMLYGSDAIGGVINVVTRSAKNIAYCDYSTGSFVQRASTADSGSYSRLNLEAAVSGMGLFGGASYLNIRDVDRGGGLGRQPFTNYSQYAGDVKIDYLIDESQLLTIALQHFEQQDVPRSDKFPGEARLFDPQQRDLGYIRWQGVGLWDFFDATMLTFSFSRQKEGQSRRKPPTATIEDVSEFNVKTTGVTLLATKDLNWAGRLQIGTDMYHDEVDAVKNRVDLVGGGVTPLVPQFPPDSYYSRFGTFLQWEVDVTERLAAVTGVRYTNIHTGATVALFDPASPNFPNDPPVDTPINLHFQDWTSSVGLVYKFSPCVHFIGSIAQGFRAPGLDELTSVSDNVNEGVDIPSVDLMPETSISYEVGVKVKSNRLQGQVYVYWTDMRGLIDRVLVGTDDMGTIDPSDDVDFFQRRNVGDALVQGVEFASGYDLGCDWSVYGNFWYTLGVNTTNDEPMSRIPPTQGTLGLRHQNECGYVDLFAWIVDRQHRLSPRDLRDSRIPTGGTPGYTTINLRAGRRLGCNQRVSVSLENIFDQLYRVHGSGVDGPGITARFGYEYVR
jgi:hemoglobin/transferrin/lactoferrin receptor protein